MFSKNPKRALWLTLSLSIVLAACGGDNNNTDTNNDADDSPALASYDALVSFGDSLSDVGTYKVGAVAALGGGQYTINRDNGAQNWIQLLAANLSLPVPCAAQTGLNGLASQGFEVPVQNNAGCTAYAQGGARITNPVGPGNALLGGDNAILGQLTVPVATQMQTHLDAAGGTYTGNEIVFVLAGGNDVFINLGAVGEEMATPEQAVTAMGVAGGELAGYVQTLLLDKGATRVVVVNLPDVSKTPLAYGQPTANQLLIEQMSATFNQQLAAGLVGTEDKVVLVDAYAVSRQQAADPAAYGITNARDIACDLSQPGNALGSALVCTTSNLVDTEEVVSRYQFADAVHPTPYGSRLIAELVSNNLVSKGWLAPSQAVTRE
ncbi:MAG: SGNH/GDSL hydrolase family protein [Burkholderiaceae bacterium]